MATIGEDMKAGEIEKIKAEVRAEERAYPSSRCSASCNWTGRARNCSRRVGLPSTSIELGRGISFSVTCGDCPTARQLVNMLLCEGLR